MALRYLFDNLGEHAPEHPMTSIIRDGLEATPVRRRRARAERRAV